MGMFQSIFGTKGKGDGLAVASAVAAALALASCADNRGGPIAYNPANFGVPDAPALASLETDYRIAPMDTLSISVFKMPDLTGEYQVDLTGQISLPLIGEVAAANMTTA